MRTDPNVISAYATVAAASVAAIAAGVSSFQTAVAVRQTNISEIQAELAKAQNDLAGQQLKIAQQQIDLTKQQAEIAAETEQFQLRPYISLKIARYSSNNGLWHLEANIKNNGLTPALNVKFFFDQYIGDMTGSITDEEWKTKPALGDGPYDLAQGEEHKYSMEINLKNQGYQDAGVGEAVKTIMRVDYEDVFHKERATYLCYAIVKHEKSMITIEKCFNPKPS